MSRLDLIQRSDIYTLFPTFPVDYEIYALNSNPIFAGFIDEPVCVVGVIPQHESGTCALWSWHLPAALNHPYIYARWTRRLITRVHTLYPRIVGGCFPSNHRWLSSLGATFNEDTTFFTIEARHD